VTPVDHPNVALIIAVELPSVLGFTFHKKHFVGVGSTAQTEPIICPKFRGLSYSTAHDILLEEVRAGVLRQVILRFARSCARNPIPLLGERPQPKSGFGRICASTHALKRVLERIEHSFQSEVARLARRRAGYSRGHFLKVST